MFAISPIVLLLVTCIRPTFAVYGTFQLQTATVFDQVAGDNWQFLVADNRDLVGIKKSATASLMTEVHVASASSGYAQFVLQTATALHMTDSTYEFMMAPNRDLVAVKKSNTSTGFTEVHFLSAASNYKTFTVQTRTVLHATDATWQFLIATNRDIFCIKMIGASGQTEVHVLDSASNYQQFSLQIPTALHITMHPQYTFLLAGTGDMYVIKKYATGTGSTEVHVLSASSNYQRFSLQTGTCLHETDNSFSFGMSRASQHPDIFAIKKSGTDSGKLELHSFH